MFNFQDVSSYKYHPFKIIDLYTHDNNKIKQNTTHVLRFYCMFWFKYFEMCVDVPDRMSI